MPRDITQDINMNVDQIDPKYGRIEYASDPDNIPIEFAHVPLDIDESINVPIPLREKTHSQPR